MGVTNILKKRTKALAPLILFAILSGCKVSKEKLVKSEPTDPAPTAPVVVAPAPAPVTGASPSPALSGALAIASEFDIYSELTSAPIPASAAPDVVGAFRFVCTAGQLLKDDPIVYPGQPGKSHLHQFYGNTGANASSTYSSLRKSGQSTCMSPLNRSAYWMPDRNGLLAVMPGMLGRTVAGVKVPFRSVTTWTLSVSRVQVSATMPVSLMCCPKHASRTGHCVVSLSSCRVF